VRNAASKTIAALTASVLVTGATYLTAQLSAVSAAPLTQLSSLPDVGMFATPNTLIAASTPWWATRGQSDERVWVTTSRIGQANVRLATTTAVDVGAAGRPAVDRTVASGPPPTTTGPTASQARTAEPT
jgi:hypothetical protein